MLRYREVETWDVQNLVEVRTDPTTYPFLHNSQFFSAYQTEEFIKTLGSTSRRIIVENTVQYSLQAATAINTTEFVGVIRLDFIDHNNRNLYVGLDIVPNYRGKGLAKEIYGWLLNYLFMEMNYNAVYLEVLDTNAKAIYIYQKLGFINHGFFPQKVFREGRYIDSILMALTRENYQKRQATEKNIHTTKIEAITAPNVDTTN